MHKIKYIYKVKYTEQMNIFIVFEKVTCKKYTYIKLINIHSITI